MNDSNNFDAWFGSIGSHYEHIRPPAKKGLSRRFLGFIDVESATIRIADPCQDGVGALTICTGGDALYPVFGTFDDGELLEVMFAVQYFWRLPEISFSPLEPVEEDDLARLLNASNTIEMADNSELGESTDIEIAAARKFIADYDKHCSEVRTKQIASIRKAQLTLQRLRAGK